MSYKITRPVVVDCQAVADTLCSHDLVELSSSFEGPAAIIVPSRASNLVFCGLRLCGNWMRAPGGALVNGVQLDGANGVSFMGGVVWRMSGNGFAVHGSCNVYAHGMELVSNGLSGLVVDGRPSLSPVKGRLANDIQFHGGHIERNQGSAQVQIIHADEVVFHGGKIHGLEHSTCSLVRTKGVGNVHLFDTLVTGGLWVGEDTPPWIDNCPDGASPFSESAVCVARVRAGARMNWPHLMDGVLDLSRGLPGGPRKWEVYQVGTRR